MKNNFKKTLLCFSCIIALVLGMSSTASAKVKFPAMYVNSSGTLQMAVTATKGETKAILKLKNLKNGNITTKTAKPGSVFSIGLRRNTWFKVGVSGYNKSGRKISTRTVYFCSNPTMDSHVSGKYSYGSGYITYSWPSVYKSTGYKVYMSKGDKNHFQCVSTTTAKSYTVYNVPRGVKYYFYVRPYLRLKSGTTILAPKPDTYVYGWF